LGGFLKPYLLKFALEFENRISFVKTPAATLLERHMHSAMTADSILNHMLKNGAGDAEPPTVYFL